MIQTRTLILIQYYMLTYRSYSRSTISPTTCLLSSSGPNPGFSIPFSRQIKLFSPNGLCLCLSWHLCLQRTPLATPSIWICLVFLSCRTKVMRFGQKYYRRDIVFFLVHIKKMLHWPFVCFENYFLTNNSFICLYWHLIFSIFLRNLVARSVTESVESWLVVQVSLRRLFISLPQGIWEKTELVVLLYSVSRDALWARGPLFLRK